MYINTIGVQHLNQQITNANGKLRENKISRLVGVLTTLPSMAIQPLRENNISRLVGALVTSLLMAIQALRENNISRLVVY